MDLTAQWEAEGGTVGFVLVRAHPENSQATLHEGIMQLWGVYSVADAPGSQGVARQWKSC